MLRLAEITFLLQVNLNFKYINEKEGKQRMNNIWMYPICVCFRDTKEVRIARSYSVERQSLKAAIDLELMLLAAKLPSS